VSEREDGGKERDGPFVNTDDEDAIVEAVEVVGDEEVDVCSVCIVTGPPRCEAEPFWWQKRRDGTALVEDHGIAIHPHEPFQAFLCWFDHLAHEEGENERWLVPQKIDDRIAHDFNFVPMNQAVK
jgi:hypothetical protein